VNHQRKPQEIVAPKIVANAVTIADASTTADFALFPWRGAARRREDDFAVLT